MVFRLLVMLPRFLLLAVMGLRTSGFVGSGKKCRSPCARSIPCTCRAVVAMTMPRGARVPEHKNDPECGCWSCVSNRQTDKRLDQLMECIEMSGFNLLPWQVDCLRVLVMNWTVENPNTEHVHWQAPGHDSLSTRTTLKMWGEANERGN